MSDAQHTPTPYIFDGHSCIEATGHASQAQRAAADGVSGSARNGKLTVACLLHDMCPEQTVSHYNESEARANLKFICLACNAHDDLLAACKEAAHALGQYDLADEIEVGNDDNDETGFGLVCLDVYTLNLKGQLDAAIAKAKDAP